MNKFILFLAVSMFFCSSVTTNAATYADDIVSDYRQKFIENSVIQNKFADTVISGNLPMVTGLSSTLLQKDLNEKIKEIYEHHLGKITESDISITFNYDIKIDNVKIGGINNEIVSFLIYSEASSGSVPFKRVSSINYSELTEKIINITSGPALGPNAVKLANKFIKNEIKQNPNRYNSNFTSITEDQSFALENENIIIYFDEYEIAPGSEGIIEFQIPKKGISNYYMSKDQYYTKTLYNLKMIELNRVAKWFGYTLVWDGLERKVYISRNKQLITTITIGYNGYNKGRLAIRSLETAPEIYKDRTYVPISFFEEILDQSYSVDQYGTVTFSEYFAK